MENNSNQAAFDEAVKVLGKELFGVNNKVEPLSEEQETALFVNTPTITSRYLLMQPALKLMEGKFAGAFYVRYLQDSVSKVGWLQMIIEYPDSSCKDVILCKNQYAEADMSKDGMYKFVIDAKRPRKAPLEWGNEMAINPYLLTKYESPNMPIPGPVLWGRIVRNYETIPVVAIHQKAGLDEIYLELAKRAMEILNSGVCGTFVKSADRYYIPKDIFENVAITNGYTPDKLKATLDLAGLLIKDKGTRGYQYSQRVKGVIVRFYVLRKLTDKENEGKSTVADMVSCTDLSFETTFVTAQEEASQTIKKYTETVHKVMDNHDLSQEEIHKLYL